MNLIVNPVFEEGVKTPRAWQWVVLAGHPEWSFDYPPPWQRRRRLSRPSIFVRHRSI